MKTVVTRLQIISTIIYLSDMASQKERTAPLFPLTQLFFFFFLASSFRLPTLEWLVMLFRLEMLSDEFCLLIRNSERRDKEHLFGIIIIMY